MPQMQTDNTPASDDEREYTTITITITDHVLVPKGTKINIAPTGVQSSFTLPDGTILKPWISYERDEDEDLTTDDLHKLGVFLEMASREYS